MRKKPLRPRYQSSRRSRFLPRSALERQQLLAGRVQEIRLDVRCRIRSGKAADATFLHERSARRWHVELLGLLKKSGLGNVLGYIGIILGFRV